MCDIKFKYLYVIMHVNVSVHDLLDARFERLHFNRCLFVLVCMCEGLCVFILLGVCQSVSQETTV